MSPRDEGRSSKEAAVADGADDEKDRSGSGPPVLTDGESRDADRAPELVFGLVGPIGTDLDVVYSGLGGALLEHGYTTIPIKLSGLFESFEEFADEIKGAERYDERVAARMSAGTTLRSQLRRGDVLPVLALTQIGGNREERVREIREHSGSNEPEDDDQGTPYAPRTAYVLDQLKHPAEIATLRDIYGDHFILIAASATRETRLNHLAERIASSGYTGAFHRDYLPEAQALMRRDEAEELEHLRVFRTNAEALTPNERIQERERLAAWGQNVRATFPLADFFVDTSDPGALNAEVGRFIELLFGNTLLAPTQDEHAMFHAKASALRSSALARQVGAAITTPGGELVALGSNEVPKPGGGLYWPGDKGDAREVHRSRDSADETRELFAGQLVKRLEDLGFQAPDDFVPSSESLFEILRHTRLGDLAEFGRSVHAEMAALTDAAMRGAAVRGDWLYTTTFPCHNCARHLIAAGISRVIYVEPYSKSMAADLHEDAIRVDHHPDDKYVHFNPFVGVAPRLYMTLFEISARKDDLGRRIVHEPKSSMPRIATDRLASYRQLEEAYSGLVRNRIAASELTPKE
jgi:cytidine deaminase